MKFVLLATILLSGCATLFQGGPDKVPVHSEPDGAKVYLNDMLVGSTPCTISIPHNQDARIAVVKDGYDRIDVTPGKVFSGWFFADIISVAGGIIDLATSNQGHYPADAIRVQLNKKVASTN